jgi:hypothetical protein
MQIDQFLSRWRHAGGSERANYQLFIADLRDLPGEDPRSGLPEWDGQQFAFDDPRIPLPLGQSVASLAQAGNTL